jgi:hypothetical protein
MNKTLIASRPLNYLDVGADFWQRLGSNYDAEDITVTRKYTFDTRGLNGEQIAGIERTFNEIVKNEGRGKLAGSIEQNMDETIEQIKGRSEKTIQLGYPYVFNVEDLTGQEVVEIETRLLHNYKEAAESRHEAPIDTVNFAKHDFFVSQLQKNFNKYLTRYMGEIPKEITEYEINTLEYKFKEFVKTTANDNRIEPKKRSLVALNFLYSEYKQILSNTHKNKLKESGVYNGRKHTDCMYDIPVIKFGY